MGFTIVIEATDGQPPCPGPGGHAGNTGVPLQVSALTGSRIVNVWRARLSSIWSAATGFADVPGGLFVTDVLEGDGVIHSATSIRIFLVSRARRVSGTGGFKPFRRACGLRTHAGQPNLSRPHELGPMAGFTLPGGFPLIKHDRLESYRSSITFRCESFESDSLSGLRLYNENRITVLAFFGERGRGGIIQPVPPHRSRRAPLTPTGSPGGGPDPSD